MAPSREGGMRRRVMVVKMKERILVTKVALRLDRKATIVGLLQSFKPHRLNNKYDVVVVSFLVGLAGRWRCYQVLFFENVSLRAQTLK